MSAWSSDGCPSDLKPARPGVTPQFKVPRALTSASVAAPAATATVMAAAKDPAAMRLRDFILVTFPVFGERYWLIGTSKIALYPCQVTETPRTDWRSYRT